MIAAERDQMGADETVGGEAANEEGGEQEPERLRRRCACEVAERGGERIALRRRRGMIVVLAAERAQADRGGPAELALERERLIERLQQPLGSHARAKPNAHVVRLPERIPRSHEHSRARQASG